MRWWQTPIPIEDLRLIAHHALLRDPGSVRSYTMIDGRPVYVGEHLAAIGRAVQQAVPALEKLGQAFIDIAPQFEAFGENIRKTMQ